MTKTNTHCTAEAILFAAGEPLPLEHIAKALELAPAQAKQQLLELQSILEEDGSLCLLEIDKKYQICTKPAFAGAIRRALQKSQNQPLSPATYEVLAVVAYHQPITKAFIDQVRGVDCHHLVTSLCQKNLLEEKGRLDLPGKPLTYGTTTAFLRAFGLQSLDDLPPLPPEEEAF